MENRWTIQDVDVLIKALMLVMLIVLLFRMASPMDVTVTENRGRGGPIPVIRLSPDHDMPLVGRTEEYNSLYLEIFRAYRDESHGVTCWTSTTDYGSSVYCLPDSALAKPSPESAPSTK